MTGLRNVVPLPYKLFHPLCAGARQLVVCDSPAGRLGLTVCYDLRFPEMYQQLAFVRGADVLLVPSAFTKLTGTEFSDHVIKAPSWCMPRSQSLVSSKHL